MRGFRKLSCLLIITILFNMVSVSAFGASLKIVSIQNLNVTVKVNQIYSLPKTVEANMSNETVSNISVTWDKKTVNTKKSGIYTYKGTVKNYTPKVILVLKVISSNKVTPTPLPTHFEEKQPKIEKNKALMKVNFMLPDGEFAGEDGLSFYLYSCTTNSNDTEAWEYKYIFLQKGLNSYTAYLPVSATGGNASCIISYEISDAKGYLSGYLGEKGTNIYQSDYRIEVKEGKIKEITLNAIKGVVVSGNVELPEAVTLSKELNVSIYFTERINNDSTKQEFNGYASVRLSKKNKKARYEVTLPKEKAFHVVLYDIYEKYPIEYGTLLIENEKSGSMQFNIKPDIKSLVPEIDQPNTQANEVNNWAQISSVQQFKYKNEGLAYAYVKDSNIIISTPSIQLSFEMKYPILGDVLSDDDGNFYVVWGKQNDNNDSIIETVFISKYSSEGQHIKTTGFVGKSSPWGDDDSAKTKSPFWAGNCVSVIENGILVNYHTKQRYDGHQSDNVIAVRISDMSAYPLPNDTFSGHSFNQSLIYCKRTSDFLFASQGDAYVRGFRVNDMNGKYGNENENIFHFYLEANVDYNMWIVNKTFAQLGGLAETSKGVALVGASAMSISEAAKTEKQNLFIQIFDPLIKDLSPSMFVGGSPRSGATSFDINDNNNSPLTNVSDYGIIWLTDYTDKDVIAPQVVVADDRIVILWTESGGSVLESYYMVLSAGGDVLTPATSLGGLKLNSYEMPIYQDGLVYWAYAYNGCLRAVSIKP